VQAVSVFEPELPEPEEEDVQGMAEADTSSEALATGGTPTASGGAPEGAPTGTSVDLEFDEENGDPGVQITLDF
jgi:hypothetical protein